MAERCRHHGVGVFLCCSGEADGVVGRHQAVVVGWSFPCPQAVVVAVEVVGKDREWLKQLAHFCTAGSSHRPL